MQVDRSTKIENNLKNATQFFQLSALFYEEEFRKHFRADSPAELGQLATQHVLGFMCFILGFKALDKEPNGPEIEAKLMAAIEEYRQEHSETALTPDSMRLLILHAIKVEDRINISYIPPAVKPADQQSGQTSPNQQPSLPSQEPANIQTTADPHPLPLAPLPESKPDSSQLSTRQDPQLSEALNATILNYEALLRTISDPRQKQIWQSIIKELQSKQAELQREMNHSEDPVEVEKQVNVRLQHVFYQLLRKKYVATDNTSFQLIQKKLQFMNIARFLQFCSDFKVFSTKVTKEQATVLFKRHSTDKLLDFNQFILIMRDFSKHSHKEEYSPQHYVDFMRSIGLADSKAYAALLKEQGLDLPSKSDSFKLVDKVIRSPRLEPRLEKTRLSAPLVKESPKKASRQKMPQPRRDELIGELVGERERLKQRDRQLEEQRKDQSRNIRKSQTTKRVDKGEKEGQDKPNMFNMRQVKHSVDLSILLDEEQDDLLSKLTARQHSSSVADKTLRRAQEQRQKESRRYI